MNAIRTKPYRRGTATALAAMFTLLTATGCTPAEAGPLFTLIGDLARQLLTFWIL